MGRSEHGGHGGSSLCFGILCKLLQQKVKNRNNEDTYQTVLHMSPCSAQLEWKPAEVGVCQGAPRRSKVGSLLGSVLNT